MKQKPMALCAAELNPAVYFSAWHCLNALKNPFNINTYNKPVAKKMAVFTSSPGPIRAQGLT